MRFEAFILSLALTGILFSGCTTPRNPLPAGLAHQSTPPGYSSEVRVVLDLETFNDPGDRARLVAFTGGLTFDGGPDGAFNLLQLSGGGEFGAFGAGLINGMTRSGLRPEFDMVTGVSTGALSAPMAFLGPDYDGLLKEGYTQITPKDIFELKGPIGLVRNPESVASSDPLQQMIARVMTEGMMLAIADGHRQGRRLYLSTAYLDDQKLVVWDIGAIAASGNPGSLGLIHKIMLASASIPVAFPPVMFEVENDGARFDELHVDGGIFAQSVGLGLLAGLDVWPDADIQKNLYLVINSPVVSEYTAVERNIGSIGVNTLMTMLKNSNRWDILRTTLVTEDIDFDLRYHTVPRDFERKTGEPFDPVYMNKLFEEGLRLGQDPGSWIRPGSRPILPGAD